MQYLSECQQFGTIGKPQLTFFDKWSHRSMMVGGDYCTARGAKTIRINEIWAMTSIYNIHQSHSMFYLILDWS